MKRVLLQTGVGKVPSEDLESKKKQQGGGGVKSSDFIYQISCALLIKNLGNNFCYVLTNHCLYAIANQHGQEAMVWGSAGAVDDVGKLGRPLQMDNWS